MNRQDALRTIAEEIRNCPDCRVGGAGIAVPGEGPVDAEVVLVGEAPGKEESRAGTPFTGRAGKFLRAAAFSAGLDLSRFFITSPVHYLPVAGRPGSAMIEHGTLHLKKQLEIIAPRIVLLMGATACRALLGRNVAVAAEHGSLIPCGGRTCLITLHPAHAMRFPGGKKKFLADLQMLKKLLNESVPGR